MKKIYLFIATVVILFSCNDKYDKIVFEPDLSDLEITFEPFPGGAFMNYVLPDNTDVYCIQAKYKDFNNKEIIVKGTHTNDQIKLFGFNEIAQDIPIEISLLDTKGHSSKSIYKSFSTKASPSVSVFDNLEVKSYWNGFQVLYSDLDSDEGFININYVGINPETQKIDTLLVSSTPFQKGKFKYNFTKVEDSNLKESTVVVTTEDFRGNRIKKEVYKNIPVAHAKRFDSSDIGFEGSSLEDGVKKTSWKYLFDGDNKSLNCFLNEGDGFFSFLSDKYVITDPEKNIWTFDLKKSTELAWIRIYSHINAKVRSSGGWLLNMKYDLRYKYPNHFKIYGTNDPDASIDECDELGEYYQAPSMNNESKWIWPALNPSNNAGIDELERFEKIPANYVEVCFDITGKKYRYLKLRVFEAFYTVYYGGTVVTGHGQLAMEEFEVFEKSEN